MDRTTKLSCHTYISENTSANLTLEVLIVDPWPQIIVQGSQQIDKLLAVYSVIKLVLVSGSPNLEKSITYSTSDICKSGRVRYYSPIQGIEIHDFTYKTLVELTMTPDVVESNPDFCLFLTMYRRSYDDELIYKAPGDMILINALSRDT